MALNTINSSSLQVEDADPPYTDRFTYLGRTMSRDGGTDLKIQSRLNKAGLETLPTWSNDVELNPRLSYLTLLRRHWRYIGHVT